VRPVNLIPSDERRGDRSAMRTGSFTYVLIGGLAIALLAVIGLAFTSKQISDRKGEVAQLTQQEQAANAKAQSLKAFTDFRAVQESRAATVVSLAQSRFDWQRVLNELARVIPSDVWLTQMAGTVSPSVQVEGAPDISMRAEASGPALSIIGCAASQDAVAGFVGDLENIDGVTRVGVQSSQRGDVATSGGGATSGSASSDSQDCRTRDFIFQFQVVAAFDAVPDPATASTAPSVPPSVAPSTGSALAAQPASAPTGG
jgi:Tfp pilus assembly protein PilN